MIKDTLKEWSFLIVAVVILTVSVTSYKIWHSDTFQEKYNPKEYWTERVRSLEAYIKNQKVFLEHERMELMKKQMTMPIDVAQAVNLANTSGDDSSDTRKTAIEIAQDKIKGTKEVIKILEKGIADTKKELGKAKQELLKHQ